MKSLVILAPEPHLAETNAMLHDLGWPEDNFTVALSVTGAAPKTHCGLRASVDVTFYTAIEQKLARKSDLAAALIINTCSEKNRHQQFPLVVAAAGFQLILPQVD